MKIANTKYTETLDLIEKAQELLERIESNVESQIPQKLGNQFIRSKIKMINWLEEIESTLVGYLGF